MSLSLFRSSYSHALLCHLVLQLFNGCLRYWYKSKTKQVLQNQLLAICMACDDELFEPEHRLFAKNGDGDTFLEILNSQNLDEVVSKKLGHTWREYVDSIEIRDNKMIIKTK